MALYDTEQAALGMKLMETADELADEVEVWTARFGRRPREAVEGMVYPERDLTTLSTFRFPFRRHSTPSVGFAAWA